MKYHLVRTHGQEFDDYFPCKQCKLSCSTQELLEKHVKESHIESDDGNHTCQKCNMIFKGQGAYIIHYKTKHNNTLPPEFDGFKKYYCEQCGIPFLSEKDYKNHSQIVHEKIKKKKKQVCLPCPHCSRTFDRSRKLNSHIENAHKND